MKLDGWSCVKRLDLHLPLMEFSNPLTKLHVEDSARRFRNYDVIIE